MGTILTRYKLVQRVKIYVIVNNTIYLQKPVKLNNSTCIDSDSSEDSTDSEQEEVEASKPVKPMGCIQSRGTGVNKVLFLYFFELD